MKIDTAAVQLPRCPSCGQRAYQSLLRGDPPGPPIHGNRQIKLGAVQHIAYGAVIEGVRVKVGHRRGNLVHFMPAGVQKGGDRWTPGPVVPTMALISSADGRPSHDPTRDGAAPLRD